MSGTTPIDIFRWFMRAGRLEPTAPAGTLAAG
jgi:hypothetical protein